MSARSGAKLLAQKSGEFVGAGIDRHRQEAGILGGKALADDIKSVLIEVIGARQDREIASAMKRGGVADAALQAAQQACDGLARGVWDAQGAKFEGRHRRALHHKKVREFGGPGGMAAIWREDPVAVDHRQIVAKRAPTILAHLFNERR